MFDSSVFINWASWLSSHPHITTWISRALRTYLLKYKYLTYTHILKEAPLLPYPLRGCGPRENTGMRKLLAHTPRSLHHDTYNTCIIITTTQQSRDLQAINRILAFLCRHQQPSIKSPILWSHQHHDTYSRPAPAGSRWTAVPHACDSGCMWRAPHPGAAEWGSGGEWYVNWWCRRNWPEPARHRGGRRAAWSSPLRPSWSDCRTRSGYRPRMDEGRPAAELHAIIQK